MPDISAETSFVFDYVERNKRAIALLGDNIFYFGELGMQEFETAGLMTSLLEKAGFKVERGIAGFETGFCATYGSGKPVVAIHTEYDAVPDNSQMAGITGQKHIIEGAPGHCEGHNVNAAVLVASALAAKAAMERFGLKGTLKVFGAPAEEQLISRPYLVRDGWFDDVDVAFHDHISSDWQAGHGLIQSALISAMFTFHGESAHSGTAPEKARDSLDAVTLMDMGMAQYREHMPLTSRIQRAITNGGDQPNTTPRKASIWWYFRDASAEGAQKLFEQAKKVAQGAALMTNTESEVEVLAAVWPLRGNGPLSELVQDKIALVGMPEWTDEEQRFARELQTNAGVKPDGLVRESRIRRGQAEQKWSANDAGDVSWKVPMVKLYYPANVPHLAAHHWAAGAPLAMSIAHKGAVAGAKVMASSILECFVDPARIEEAKQAFKEELGDRVYSSLLPPGQKPPAHLNRDTMEKFRPAMQKHYLTEKPDFS
jgi:aminobenzoyl-glutamate utilization protein B